MTEAATRTASSTEATRESPLDTHQAVQVRKPRRIEGWALQALVRYDEAYPGILRSAMSASAFRRQAIFLVLAAAFPNRVDMIADRVRGVLAESFPASGNPHEAIAYTNLGAALYEQGQRKEAVETLEKASRFLREQNMIFEANRIDEALNQRVQGYQNWLSIAKRIFLW